MLIDCEQYTLKRFKLSIAILNVFLFYKKNGENCYAINGLMDQFIEFCDVYRKKVRAPIVKWNYVNDEKAATFSRGVYRICSLIICGLRYSRWDVLIRLWIHISICTDHLRLCIQTVNVINEKISAILFKLDIDFRMIVNWPNGHNHEWNVLTDAIV